MKMKTLLAVAAVGFLALSGAVVAQSITVPTVSTLNPTADRMAVVPNGAPSARSVYASPAQVNAALGYSRSAPVTGFTFTFGADQSVAAFRPAGTLATGTVTLAANPSDGAQECIFSTQTITALTVNANTGQTIDDAVTTLSADAHACYLYSRADTTWYRSE